MTFRHHDARPQSRLFARCSPRLRHSPNSNRLAVIVSDDFPVFHAQRIPARLLFDTCSRFVNGRTIKMRYGLVTMTALLR
jgi:hypothetical protein